MTTRIRRLGPHDEAEAEDAVRTTTRGNVPARRLYARTGGRVEDESAIVVTYPL